LAIAFALAFAKVYSHYNGMILFVDDNCLMVMVVESLLAAGPGLPERPGPASLAVPRLSEETEVEILEGIESPRQQVFLLLVLVAGKVEDVDRRWVGCLYY